MYAKDSLRCLLTCGFPLQMIADAGFTDVVAEDRTKQVSAVAETGTCAGIWHMR